MTKKIWLLSLFCASFTIMSGLWVAYHLFYLVLYGEGVIREPRQWLATLEFALTMLIVGVGCYTWYKLAWKPRLGG